MFKEVDVKQNFATMEKDIVKYWKENKIFKQSVDNITKPNYSFFDGPPFATGLPHYGHVVASLIKDTIPRFWTMKGYNVPRRWGWDCHGLPVENLIEKELGISHKQEIEDMGVGCFNEVCRKSVLRYVNEWKEFVPSIGRWVDMEKDYKTMDPLYMESIWWVFAEIYKKGLVYEGYKAMHLCPRCETTLSNFEVTQGYKDITDLSAVVKFAVSDNQPIGDSYKTHNTYILAWTTTPWTLPGNMALAVGEDLEYVIIRYQGCDYVLAKDCSENFSELQEQGVRVAEGVLGKDLCGLKYHSLFNYYSNQEDLKNKDNGWQVYGGDFVTTTEGTGVVHIAPSFGEDDMKLAQKYQLPFVKHVLANGRFVDFFTSLPIEMQKYFIDKDGLGREVKPKRNHRETDEKVVEYLQQESKIFLSQNYKHSYPHCWRCSTPLLNYATNSWFVNVTQIKQDLIQNNQQVNWVPDYIKDGRFGKWLEDARDWAVSRSRFWGTPLPVWRCSECRLVEVVGSIDEMREKTDQVFTKFIFVRHGLAENNVQQIRSSGKLEHKLVQEGQDQIYQLGENLIGEKIDIIISSPLLRTVESADILANKLNLPVQYDDLVREYNFGQWDGCTDQDLVDSDNQDYQQYVKFSGGEEKYCCKLGTDGESRDDIEKRIRQFITNCTTKYAGKNILVVSHAGIGAMFHKILVDSDIESFFYREFNIDNAESLIFYADNQGQGLDLHRPYIEKVQCKCSKCGQAMSIVGDVFDCWFESGAMPYAQIHYPFENKKEFQQNFPADFIAEGIDQTRGWFYTLMVLSTALFNKPAFKNVITNGIVLAEDGQKMSKSLRNYPDPNQIIEKYGADALRYYLLTSPVVKGENLRFSERGVEEVFKKFILTVWNVYAFFVLHVKLHNIQEQDLVMKTGSQNLLDIWILSELNLLIREIDNQMMQYDLVKASRVLREFIDKLSNWYLRRSRKRFSSEDITDRLFAYQTMYYVLNTLSKLMAPFTPFIAEEMFRNLNNNKSVHLELFPQYSENLNEEVLKKMDLVREVVVLGLAARATAKIKVRMPLALLEIQSEVLSDLEQEYLDIIKEELNVKEVLFVLQSDEGGDKQVMENSGGSLRIFLSTTVTMELQIEGVAREIVRQVQSLRKMAKYSRDARIIIYYKSQEVALLEQVWGVYGDVIKKECCALDVQLITEDSNVVDVSNEVLVNGVNIFLGVKLLNNE